MPLGFERLNARKSQPNDHINFIKPLKGKDEKIAQDFLERIAAQCGECYATHSLQPRPCCWSRFHRELHILTSDSACHARASYLCDVS